jgi:hypothetical protein
MPNWVWSAASGVVTLFGALGGYSVFAGALGSPYTLSAVIFWGIIALVGGPVFGAAGHGWRSSDIRVRVVCVALLGGIFVAEGWFTLQYNHDLLAGWVSIGMGLLLGLLLARSTKDRLYTMLAMVPITGLGMLAFALLSQIVYT